MSSSTEVNDVNNEFLLSLAAADDVNCAGAVCVDDVTGVAGGQSTPRGLRTEALNFQTSIRRPQRQCGWGLSTLDGCVGIRRHAAARLPRVGDVAERRRRGL